MSRKKYSNVPFIQSGSATLVAGAAAVANVWMEVNSRILLTRIAAAATADGLAAINTANGNGNGTFAIDSSNAADVTTIAWMIITPGGNPFN